MELGTFQGQVRQEVQIKALPAEGSSYGKLFSFSGVERVSEEPVKPGFFVVPNPPIGARKVLAAVLKRDPNYALAAGLSEENSPKVKG